MDKISICIPTYKRLDYLKAFVETVPQKYQICISDNGNFIPDGFFQRENIRIKHIDNIIPMFANWNSAIDMVETEWFIIPGDDDVIKTDSLPLIEEYVNQYKDCAYLAFAYDIIDENGKVMGGWSPTNTCKYHKVEGFRFIQRSVPFRWPSIVINTECSKAIGNFDDDFSFTAGDSLYLQTLAVKYPIAIVNNNIGQYRVWHNSFTSNKIFSKEWFDCIEMWQQKLSSLLREECIEGISIEKIHDDAMCDNLISAISLNKQANIKTRLKFVSQVGWPTKSGVKDQLLLLKSILF